MAGLKIYDADQVTVSFFGIPIESGFADGEFVRIEKDKEDFTVVEGTDGEATRSKTGSKLHKITLRLMQSSDANALLSSVRNLDLDTAGGAGVGPLLIKDRQGTSLFVAAKAWIAKPPDVSFDREAKEREWEIHALVDKRVDGGN